MNVHTHCWHASLIQHAVANHECQVCCMCGQDRCITLQDPKPWEGHGPFHPLAPLVIRPGGRVTIVGNDIHAGDTE